MKGRKYSYEGVTKEVIEKLVNKGLSNEAIAKELNVSKHMLKRIKRELNAQKPKRTTEFDKEKFHTLLNDGIYSIHEIAAIMGESFGSVQHYRFQLKESKERKKFPYKDWEFTEEQKSVLAGTLLGDSNLRVDKLGSHARFSFAHCDAQKELFDYKVSVFKDIQSYCKEKKSTPDSRTGLIYKTWTFGSRCHPNFTSIHNHLYPEGEKIINQEILEWFDARSLAILLMDDGCKVSCGYLLATNSFSIQDIDLLNLCFSTKFGFCGTITKANTLYIPAGYRDLVTSLVAPYMLPSMLYKMHCPR